MLFPAWTTYRASLWPVRFSTGLAPLARMADAMAEPTWPALTPGRMVEMAASNPASAASTKYPYSGSRQTVRAVSAMYPSTWTPTSTFTKAPSGMTVGSARGEV